jgi:hypothetical protein
MRSNGLCIKVFNYLNNIIRKFPSIMSVANYFNISNRTVGRYLDKNKSYNSFIFKPNGLEPGG